MGVQSEASKLLRETRDLALLRLKRSFGKYELNSESIAENVISLPMESDEVVRYDVSEVDAGNDRSRAIAATITHLALAANKSLVVLKAIENGADKLYPGDSTSGLIHLAMEARESLLLATLIIPGVQEEESSRKGYKDRSGGGRATAKLSEGEWSEVTSAREALVKQGLSNASAGVRIAGELYEKTFPGISRSVELSPASIARKGKS